MTHNANSGIKLDRFVFSSSGALYSSLKKRPQKMTRNSNCRAANFTQIERAGVWPESPSILARSYKGKVGIIKISVFIHLLPYNMSRYKLLQSFSS